ncbi:MAG: MBL fold metallo-hydrolase [Caldilineaceae bacterium]
MTTEGCILIDTLPFPSETRQIIEFADRICPDGIRYVINTISHADHVYGSYLFPDAELMAHEKCREMLARFGRKALDDAREHTPELLKVEIRLPKLVFSEGAVIRLGDKTVHAMHALGPSPDVVVVMPRREGPLCQRFDDAGAAHRQPVEQPGTLQKFTAQTPRFQSGIHRARPRGHPAAREVTSSIDESISYLDDIQALVDRLMAEGATKHDLLQNDVEQFGRSRIPLGGLVQNFHQANLLYLWER